MSIIVIVFTNTLNYHVGECYRVSTDEQLSIGTDQTIDYVSNDSIIHQKYIGIDVHLQSRCEKDMNLISNCEGQTYTIVFPIIIYGILTGLIYIVLITYTLCIVFKLIKSIRNGVVFVSKVANQIEKNRYVANSNVHAEICGFIYDDKLYEKKIF